MAGTIALVVAYDGGPFAGFQIQPDRETVQGRLEAALGTVLGREVSVTCAGRTDAGVHARGQVVSFEADGEEPEDSSLARSVSALAGPGVVVREVRRAGPGFSARHAALAREYVYLIATGAPPVFLERYAWWVKGELDEGPMREAARALVGEHDFASFCVAESARETPTVRDVERVDLSHRRELGEEVLAVTVEGRSFLHSMVRVIVGSLVEVGRGRRPPAWIGGALEARSRSAAGPTAPAHGLFLESVRYPEGTWR